MDDMNKIKNAILLIIMGSDREGKILSTNMIKEALLSEYELKIEEGYINGCLLEIESDGYLRSNKTLDGNVHPVLNDIGRKFIIDGSYSIEKEDSDILAVLKSELIIKMNQKFELEIHKLEKDKKWGWIKEWRNWIAIVISAGALVISLLK
jgi:hypothetical protein